MYAHDNYSSWCKCWFLKGFFSWRILTSLVPWNVFQEPKSISVEYEKLVESFLEIDRLCEISEGSNFLSYIWRPSLRPSICNSLQKQKCMSLQLIDRAKSDLVIYRYPLPPPWYKKNFPDQVNNLPYSEGGSGDC